MYYKYDFMTEIPSPHKEGSKNESTNHLPEFQSNYKNEDREILRENIRREKRLLSDI
jgi:hypothetical protein